MAKTIDEYKNDWLDAYKRGDTAAMNIAHAGAEAIRASAPDGGYSGGDDGSQRILPLVPGNAQTNNTASLMPPSILAKNTTKASDDYDIPEYKATKIKEFKYEQPDFGLPGKSDVTWVPGIALKQLDLDRQNSAADENYRGYQARLDNLKTKYGIDKDARDETQRLTENYYAGLGQVAPLYLGDKSAEINANSKAWFTATPEERERLHQSNLQYAWDMGLVPRGQDVASVSGLKGLTLAGTPTYERTYNDDKLAASKEDAAWQREFDERKLQADTDYKNAALAERSSSGGSGGGNSGGSSKPTQNDYLSAFMKSSGQYRTPTDYKADLMRYKADIIQYVGSSGWQALYEDAVSMEKGSGTKVNPNFVAGTASPLKTMLGG